MAEWLLTACYHESGNHSRKSVYDTARQGQSGSLFLCARAPSAPCRCPAPILSFGNLQASGRRIYQVLALWAGSPLSGVDGGGGTSLTTIPLVALGLVECNLFFYSSSLNNFFSIFARFSRVRDI